MGRVVFFSRYPVLLNMAVETFRYLLEMRGWQGVCQSVVHARDVKIYLEVCCIHEYLLIFQTDLTRCRIPVRTFSA